MRGAVVEEGDTRIRQSLGKPGCHRRVVRVDPVRPELGKARINSRSASALSHGSGMSSREAVGESTISGP